MAPNRLLLIYFCFLAFEFLLENFLTILNIFFTEKNSKKIPEFFVGLFSKEQYKKSVEYTLSKLKFSIVNSFFNTLFLFLIIYNGLLGFVDNSLQENILNSYFRGIIYIFSISLIFKIFSLPFSYYSQFYIEEKFGFNKMTVSMFIADTIKELVISGILFIPLLLVLFWFMDSAGKFWWIFAFGFIAVFQIIITMIYPVLIAPLFNKFKQLQDGELKEKLLKLAVDLKFNIKGIFIMDGSKRSSHSNAYFTGIGKEKRIVLFDTLVEKLKTDELLSVLAHEIGHQKKFHIVKRLITSLLMILGVLFLIDQLLNFGNLYTAFGFKEKSYYSILVIISLCVSPVAFLLNPIFSAWSRKHEYEADKFAVKSLGTVQNFKNALLELSKDNLSNLTPHPVYSFFHYSHPTLYDRLKALDKK